MAFQFDGNLKITLASSIKLVDDFKIVFPTLTHKSGQGTQSFFGKSSGNSAALIMYDGVPRLAVQGGGVNFTGVDFAVDTPVSGMTLELVGSTYTFTNGANTATGSDLGTAEFQEFSTGTSTLSLDYYGKASGVMEIYRAGVLIHSWDFSDSSDPTKLTDSVGGNHGTISGATTGGYDDVVSGGGTISLSAPVTGSIQRMNSGVYSKFAVSGAFDGLLSSNSLLYKLNGGTSLPFHTIEIDFDNDTFTGEVLIPNGTHELSVHYSNDETVIKTVTNIRAALSILFWGQSNTEGSGTNNQAVTLDSGAPVPIMIKHQNGSISVLADPTSGNSGGSVLPRIASLYANSGILVCFTNCAENGVSTSRWLKSANDLYPRTLVAADEVGGYDLATCIIGESDQGDSAADIKERMHQITNDLKADYGCDNYICYVPRSQSDAMDFQNNAYADVIDSNDSAKFGGDLSVIDVADNGGDGTHMMTDEELTMGGDIMYAAQLEKRNFGKHVSKAVMTLTGATGSKPTRVYNLTKKRLAFEGDLTWANGTVTQKVDAELGDSIEYYVMDTAGGMQRGVTS